MVDDLGAVVSDITATLNRVIDIGEDTFSRAVFVQNSRVVAATIKTDGSTTGERHVAVDLKVGKAAKAGNGKRTLIVDGAEQFEIGVIFDIELTLEVDIFDFAVLAWSNNKSSAPKRLQIAAVDTCDILEPNGGALESFNATGVEELSTPGAIENEFTASRGAKCTGVCELITRITRIQC